MTFGELLQLMAAYKEDQETASIYRHNIAWCNSNSPYKQSQQKLLEPVEARLQAMKDIVI